MKKIVLLGGNGYVGRNVIEYWLKRDNDSEFYVLSRSGKNALQDKRIKNIKVDVTNIDEVSIALPENIDYIIDFIGRPEKDSELFIEINDKPADVMMALAKEKNAKAMGFIGGVLGPKSFTQGKKRIENKLKSSGIRTVIVYPTVIYGNGRKDMMSKLVPILKLFGIFNKNMKPTHIDKVVAELVEQLDK